MKYYFWILGCAMNYSDAERLAGVLDSLGFEKTDDESEADLFVVIACSVRQHAVDRIFGKVKDWQETKKKHSLITLLTGCVLTADQTKMHKAFDIVIKTEEINRLPVILTDFFPIKNHPLSGDYLALKPKYESNFRSYVPISTGCDNFCSYCAVPYTRGREKSRPMNEILQEVGALITRGYREITLVGQNVNSYGNDRKDSSSFVKLIKDIDQIHGDYRVYFFSNHPKDMTEELITTVAGLKHFPPYLHLPLQSGDDWIINKMNRHYTRDQYLELVDQIRQIMPEVTLTTDIIVGFPGETKAQFENTAKVMKLAKFDMAFIAQYSPRPGTGAAKLTETVSVEEKKARENTLQQILAKTAAEQNKKRLHQKLKVLVDETKNDQVYGRTEGFKVVKIREAKKDMVGSFVEVEITDTSPWKLTGKLL